MIYLLNNSLEEACKHSVRAATGIGYNIVQVLSFNIVQVLSFNIVQVLSFNIVQVLSFNIVQVLRFSRPLLIITILEGKNPFNKSSMRLLYKY